MRFARRDRTPTGYFGARDASWLDHPDVHSTKKLHAECADGHSACSSNILIDNGDGSLFLPGELTPERICRKPPCWNEYAHNRPAAPPRKRGIQ